MKNYLLVNRALAAEKNVNLIEMLRGCSKRNGMAVSASNPDGQPTVNRQSRLMSHRGYLKNLAMIFAVLMMSMANVGMAWGDDRGWWGTGAAYVGFRIDGSGTNWDCNINSDGISDFEMGNVNSSLNLYFAWGKTWGKNLFNSVYIYYRVKPENASSSISYSNWGLDWRNDFDGNNSYWDNTINQSLSLSGLEAGRYEVEFYFQANGKDSKTYYLSNGEGGNYHANFTLRRKITYHDDGKTAGSAPAAEYFSGTATVKDNTGLLRRSDGKVFAGWANSLDRANAGTIDHEPGTSSMSVTLTADLDLYPVWKDGSYFISVVGASTNGTKNTTDFIAGKSLTNNAVEVNGVTFSKSYYKTNANQTSIKGQNQTANNFIVYDTKSTSTKIRVYVKNTDSSSKTLYYYLAKEGSTSETDQSVSLSAGEAKVVNIDASNSKGTRVILCDGKYDKIFITQIIAIESGTTLPLPGQTGYELAFPGRVADHFPNINGIEITGQAENLKWNSGNELRLQSGSNKYLKFTTTAATQLQVKNASGSGFYVCTDKSNPSTTGFLTSGSTAGTKNIYLDAANTYYIMGENSSNTKIQKVSFAAHSACTAPTGLAASLITYSGATFTVTDGTNANNYEFYVSTSSTAPTASTTPTYTSTSKTKEVTDLNKNTTYYAWVRTNGGYFHKSAWVALTGTSFKTLNAYDITYNCDGAESGCPATESGLALPNPLPDAPFKPGYNFDGWFTNSDKTTPAVDGAAIAANTTLYAKWTKVYATTKDFSTNKTQGAVPNQKTITTSYDSYTPFRVDNFFFGATNKLCFESGNASEQYNGWKFQYSGSTIKFFVGNDCSVAVAMGANAGCSIKYTPIDGSETTEALSTTANTTTTKDVKGGTMVTLTTTSGSTVTLKSITITDKAACSAPTSPSISGTTAYTAGGNISLTASATGTSGSTTYTWYKGATWDAASATTPVQAESTSGATFTKASCVVGDAGTYWCNISNGTGCEVQVSKTITVSCNAVAAPTALTCSAHTTTTLTFGWTNAANASGYTATLYPDEDCAETPVSSQNLSDVNTVTFSGLTPSATYYCKVQSKGDGSTYCVDGGTTAAQSGTTDAPSAPTFSPVSGSTVSGSQTITITGHSGSTVYYAWATSAQSASDIYNSGSGSHGTANAGTASVTVQSGKTLYAISRLSDVNSSVSSASYTVDDTAPTLSSSVPANSATNVNTSGTIVLTFSEAIASVDATKFTLTNATKGAVAIDGSDNTKVNIAYSEASNSTTVTLATAAGAVTDAVGNSSAALSSISFTTKAAASLTALVSGTLYKVEDMVPSGTVFGDDDVYKEGLSANTKFFLVGSAGSSTTVKFNNKEGNQKTIDGTSFTNSCWFGGEASLTKKTPTTKAIKFELPSAGTLYIYYYDNNTGGAKIKLALEGEDPCWSSTKAAAKATKESLSAGTYYLYATTGSTAIYGLQFDAAVACTTAPTVTAGSNSSVSSTTATVSCASGISSLGTGGCTISSYGFVIGTATGPTIGGSGVTQHEVGTSYASTGTSFNKNLTGLTAETTYYVRPYATNGFGTAYGTETSFTTTAAPTLYTVTFNSNGGSDVSPIEQASVDASITMPAAPTYASHTFQGWVIGGNTYAAGASYTPEANVTAYATWKADCAGGGGSGSTEVYNGENVAKGNTTASGWTINNNSDMALTSGSSNGYSYWYLASSSTNYVQFDGSASLVAGDQIKIQWTHTTANKDLTLTINGSGASLTSGGHVTTANTKMEAVYDVTSAKTVTSIKLKSSGSGGCKIYQVTIVKASGGGCCYVTYNGNGAQSGCISDKAAYTAGEGDVTILGNTGVSAYVKLGYRFNGWNTAANGSGMAYAAGDVVENISNDLTLHAQWVLDACSAPAAPTISGTASRTVGQNIELTATCASGADGSTTYTWYKGVDWATASAASPVQAAMTDGEGGRTFTKASCVAGDAGKYWCKASNGTGCEAHNETGFTVTVSAAVAEHIYYYKDANHYSEGTYSNPEGNTASSGDNKSLSSPWMICNGCKVGVDSVVAHGATYDGKGNHMNAYIKLPTGGDATTKNIKFALTAGYTGTLTMKIGGYENNPTVTLQPLNTSTGVLGDAISYSGTVSGVATTENNFGEITWDLTTPGGTYVLTVTTKTGYISQIDMTTETSAKFNVTYNGNGETGGSVPADATNYDADASVTVQAQGTMEKTNYTFGGWNTANNGTGTNYVAGSGTFSIKGATTLYAHWTQTINLAPGAKGTGSLGATVSWNGTAVRGFTAHTAAGYSLTGYYTETSGGTKVLNADGSFAATNIDGFITDGKWSRTGTAATLYAQWSGSAIVTNTLGVGSSNKWSSAISTTAPLQITSLSALAAVGGLTIVDEKGTSASDRALTCKVEASGATTKTDGKYLQLSFSIAAGYKLRVTGLDVTVRSVGKAGKYHLELEGTTGSLIPDDEQVASGAVNTIFDDAYNVELTGDVTLKLWAYGKDGSNLMEYYRLGSPIAIYGAVEESCTPPTFSGLDYSATEYTQGAAASAISVTGAENVDSYKWKYNTVNDRTSGTECGTGSSVTPATDASATTDGTRYYWCELTNGCTTVKTSTVAVTVSASASNPTVTWSDVKLNGAATTVNYGGGNYTLRATVNETGWSGTLASSMITAPAGITIHHVTTGTDASKKYIEFRFDVTTAFDREANETIGFHLSLPSISGTPNWNALTSDKQVEYEACDEGSGVGGMIYLPVKSTQTTAKSGMQYYWESTGSGRLASQYGSAMGAANNPSGYKTADSTFYYYAASTGDKWMFQTYVGGVNKIRVVFRAAGALKSSNLTISKFCYDTEYFSSQGDRQVSIGEVSPSKASFASGEDGYMEFTVPEMAANSYAYFQTGSSNIKIYGIVLYSESSGSGGSVETNPAWSDELKNGSTIDKNQGDPNFTYTISTTTNTLGGITYSSSNPSVAEVNATTGEVRITATGESTQTAVITATLARSGCYQPATRTYTVRVAGQECTITSAGTLTADKTSKCELDDVVLSLSGHDTDGTTVTWYRGETNVTSSVSNNTLTTSTPGAYSVVVSKSGCSLRSNTVNITNISAATSATKIVDRWYVKNGRLTPDIALWRLDEGTTFKSVAWSSENSTGLDFVIRDGIVYLEGKEPSANLTGADIPYTLTLTITDICGTDHELTDKTITLTHQKNTDKHVLAFVVTGKEKGGFTEGIPASQTNSVALYNEIAKNFDVLATNIYATDDEQKIKEYYSQFDIICITDYPNTKTKGSHSVSYSDAIGVMVDIRPVLTMEAWVSGLSNWNKKGISGDPKSPSTRQYTMLLQCKDHEIFAGTKLTEIGEGDDKMYRIHMVDETQHPYDTLDANYGSGTHESKKGYRYGSYPALQGFTFSQAMEDADLLPLGLIDDGAGNDLQVGLERQHEMSARMMVLGINSTAMERLTDDGKRIVINALKYLMKKNAEEIADCSTSFVGGADGDETNWMNADNWTGNTVPDKTQKVRILAPCTVPAGEKAHVAGVLIAPNDGGAYNGGSTPTTGSLTIAAGGALVVDGKVESVTAPAYNRPRATAPADLTIQTSSTAQGALIFDNFEGETQATVEMYSKASGAPNDCKWQWIATPFSNVNKAVEFYYGAWMYEWDNATHAWTQILNDNPMEPFKGYSITQEAAGSYWMNGVLASTESREQTLRSDEISGKNNGINLIGNSWTAPIQIANFEAEDFTNAHATIFILNTGLDEEGTGAVGANNSTAGQYISIPVEASALMGSTLKVIPAMQAFQVKAHAGGGSLNMDYDRLVREGAVSQEQISEPMRAPDRQMRRAPRVNKAEVERMHITIRGSRFQDEVYIFAHPDFTEGFDNGWDGEKIRGASEAVQLFVRDATSRWAVAAVPTFVGTYLATYKGEDNEYTISFDYSGDETLYWYDTKTDIYTEINAENTYTYTTDVSTIQTRFMITNENPKLEVPTGVESEKATNTKAVKFIDEDKMYIMINGRVYSADGALVK